MQHKSTVVDKSSWYMHTGKCVPINQYGWGYTIIHYTNVISKLKWLPFPKYVEYQQAVTVYKRLNELNPHYMNKLFSYTQENHSYGTWNATSSLLTLPKCNKSIGQKCISYTGPKVWNGSTEAIRCAPSLPSFKSRYLKALLYYFVTLGPSCYLCKHARGP